MNGFLIVARMRHDDLPIRLFETEIEVGNYMEKGQIQDEVERIAKEVKISTSDSISVIYIRFLNGIPVNHKVLIVSFI